MLISRLENYFRIIATGLILSCLVLDPSGASADFRGKVVGVHDGDTITVLHNANGERVRLNAIDCPELGQPFGYQAKKLASELMFGQEVTVKETGHDRYGRTLGTVILNDGRAINQLLVSEGACWWYRKFAVENIELRNLEDQARLQKRGLWIESNPIPPWDWRKAKKR